MDAKLVHVTAVLDKVAAEMLGLEASSLSSAANAASASSVRKRSAATPAIPATPATSTRRARLVVAGRRLVDGPHCRRRGVGGRGAARHGEAIGAVECTRACMLLRGRPGQPVCKGSPVCSGGVSVLVNVNRV